MNGRNSSRPLRQKVIGILGGMSNQATSEYYRMLNQRLNNRLGGWDNGEIIIVSVNLAQRFLPVSTIEAAIDAVRSGLCFGWLPMYRIQLLLDSGELLPLRVPAGGTRHVRLNLVCKDLSSGSQELISLCEMLGMNRELEVI